MVTDPLISAHSSLFDAIEAKLRVVAANSPRERLPKEELIRSATYSWLHAWGCDFVSPEAGYVDPGQPDSEPKSMPECDLRAGRGGSEIWIEVKRGLADYPGYQTKPAESAREWCADVTKLNSHKLSLQAQARAFLLVGLREPGSTRLLYSSAADAPIAQVTAAVQRAAENVAKPYIKVSSGFDWRDIRGAELLQYLWVW